MISSSLDWRSVLAGNPAHWPDEAEPGGVEVSSFEDEGGEGSAKDPAKIFQTFATHRLRYTTPRFIDWVPDAGGPPVTMHIEDMSDGQLGDYVKMKGDFGLKTWSLGGRGGKAYADDDPNAVIVKAGPKFVRKTWTEYLDYMKRNGEVCNRLNTRLYRGFGFYRRIDAAGAFIEDRGVRRQWAKDRVGEMADVLKAAGVYLGLECEPNLEFATGWELVELIEELAMEFIFFVMDNGNMAAWGYSVNEILDMFIRGLRYMLWMHIKDYSWAGKVPKPAGGPVDEHNLKHFCPCDRGRGGHAECFYFLAKVLQFLNAKARALGLPGFCCELETHLWGGGQFGGLSRHEGIGIGLEALLRLLGFWSIRAELRRYGDILTARGITADALTF